MLEFEIQLILPNGKKYFFDPIISNVSKKKYTKAKHLDNRLNKF